jgi:hypothetical protein
MPELYGFKFEKNKILSNSAPLSCLPIAHKYINKKDKNIYTIGDYRPYPREDEKREIKPNGKNKSNL